MDRTRFPGLAKHSTFYDMTATAHTIGKGAKFLRLYGVAQPAYGG